MHLATEDQTVSIGKRGRESTFPWDEWDNGKVQVVRRGVDFRQSCVSFRAVLHARAERSNRKVKTRILGDTVVFKFEKEKR
jgi:hypothetical protein